MTSAVVFADVSRHYGAVRAVDRVSFDIADGEFFSMLGPSGSGKTTCLRLIAGFDQPDSGRISIHGDDVAGVPPYARDVNTVFQDYALFPHMTVQANVEYGPMIRGVAPAERARLAGELLELVKLSGLGGRKPSELSGGQRQRVALARALVNKPAVLLLDEPLGALDLKLREQMQVELKAIQRQVGITFVYVTHDQGEALSMSDRLAVFNHGRIEQIGTPQEIYDRPQTEFVAGFVGVSNLLSGSAAERVAGRPATFSIRPEKIQILPPTQMVADGHMTAAGKVANRQYFGASTRYGVALEAGSELTVILPNNGAGADVDRFVPGSDVRLAWERRHVHWLSAETAP
ncbi:MAG TPA: ABC transporter ATP-binding protein [Vineibacter sp.]|nr:ABC transporter ATP-binding protein [Vineibacter sp.]